MKSVVKALKCRVRVRAIIQGMIASRLVQSRPLTNDEVRRGLELEQYAQQTLKDAKKGLGLDENAK